MKIIIWDQNNQDNQDLKNTMSDGCSTVVQLVGLDGRVGWGREQIIVRFSKCSAAWQILPTTNCRPVCISFLCGWSQYILSHILNICWSRILNIFGHISSSPCFVKFVFIVWLVFLVSHKWLAPGAYVDLPDLLCRAACHLAIRHLAICHLATSHLATCHLATKLSDHNPPHSILQQWNFEQQWDEEQQ